MTTRPSLRWCAPDCGQGSPSTFAYHGARNGLGTPAARDRSGPRSPLRRRPWRTREQQFPLGCHRAQRNREPQRRALNNGGKGVDLVDIDFAHDPAPPERNGGRRGVCDGRGLHAVFRRTNPGRAAGFLSPDPPGPTVTGGACASGNRHLAWRHNTHLHRAHYEWQDRRGTGIGARSTSPIP